MSDEERWRPAVSEEEEIQRFIELERALDIQQKQMMKIFMLRVEKALRTPGLTTEEKIQLAARELARCPDVVTRALLSDTIRQTKEASGG